MSVYDDVCRICEVEEWERKGRYVGYGMKKNERIGQLNVCVTGVMESQGRGNDRRAKSKSLSRLCMIRR